MRWGAATLNTNTNSNKNKVNIYACTPSSTFNSNFALAATAIPNLIIDFSATGNYISFATPHKNRHPTLTPISVKMPDGRMATSTHTCKLLLPADIPPLARKAHIFPDFPGASLVSVGTLCDEGCTAHFDATSIIVLLRGRVVLSGTRTAATGLWIVNDKCRHTSTINTPHQASRHAHATAEIAAQPVAYLARHCPPMATIAQRIAFLHAAMCNPALSTLCHPHL